MTFTITDPGFDFTAVWVCGIISVALLAWAIVASVGYSKKWWGDGVPALAWFIAIIFTACGFLLWSTSVPGETHDSKVHDAQIVELTNLGFDNVDLIEDRFVADKDGAYFQGIISEIEPYTFQVNEIVESSK